MYFVLRKCSNADHIYSKTESIDVDDKIEYKDMVTKICEKKPKKVTILVEMTDVKKGCKKAQVGLSCSEIEGFYQ